MPAGSLAPIVTIGEICAVFLADDGFPLGTATRFDQTFAGAESNVAIALARLQVPVVFIGRVGADSLGAAAVRHLRGEGVDVTQVLVDQSASTGVIVRSATSARSIEVIYARARSAGSRLELQQVSDAVISSAAALHVTGVTPMLSTSAAEAVAHAVRVAREHAVPVSFDPNVRFRLGSADEIRTRLSPLVPDADLVLTSVEEALFLSGAASADAAEEWFFAQGVRLVVMKDGANGAWATDGETTLRAPVFPTLVADPVGAGDAFDAGFLSVYRFSGTVDEALHRGAVLGSAVVASRGDTSGLPNSARLDSFSAVSDVVR